jgi:hypothetical protein
MVFITMCMFCQKNLKKIEDKNVLEGRKEGESMKAFKIRIRNETRKASALTSIIRPSE